MALENATSVLLQFQTLSIGAETGSLSSSYFPLLMDRLSRKLSLEYQTEVSIHTENVFSVEYEIGYLRAPAVVLKNKLPIPSRFLRDASSARITEAIISGINSG